MTQNIPGLSWVEYQGDPNNLVAQFQLNLANETNYIFATAGNVQGGVAAMNMQQTADGVAIDNTFGTQPVIVMVGQTFQETVPAYTKSVVQLGGKTGSSTVVTITGLATGGSVLVSFYKGQYPGSIFLQNLYGAQNAAVQMAFPPGLVVMSCYIPSATPSGWLPCEGQAVSRTTYANLFLAIGTTFGSGDGSTTFNVPDFRGVFPRGYDDGKGYDPARIFGSYQGDMVMSHVHLSTTGPDGYNLRNTGNTPSSPFGNVLNAFGGASLNFPGTLTLSSTTTDSFSGGAATSWPFFTTNGTTAQNQNWGSQNQENKVKNLALAFIIKT